MAQIIQSVVFYVLAALLLVSASVVVGSANIVRSAFALVLTFTCIGGLYFNLNADFVAAVQILIYVGAITIIMLFGIMLTSRSETIVEEKSGLFIRYLGVVPAVGLLILLAVFFRRAAWDIKAATVSDTAPVIGRAFFNEYLIPFEVASVILLMAMIGAIVLARKGAKRT